MLTVTPQYLNDLGWSRVVSAVRERAATAPGAEAAEGLGFLASASEVGATLAQVAELRAMLESDAALPLDDVFDIRATLARCARGGVANGPELVEVARTATAIGRCRRHLSHHADRAPALAVLLEQLPDISLLATELAATFDESGAVADDASPELAAARKKLGALHREIKARLDRYLARREIAELCQDLYYTQRDDRYVVPIIASHQSQVPGIIHGTSNTAQTVFIEPNEFVALNNEIKVAESQAEVLAVAVLRERSAWVAAESTELAQGYQALVRLDLLQARGRLARDLDCHVPRFSEDGTIALSAARNPHLLLKGSAVVANDITLSAERSFLVITGPNTGGKTVTLNTVGNFALMLAAGIPIPAGPDSVMTPVGKLFALIGDPQDIERDLSTFSGHLLSVQRVLDEVGPGSLVLLDEIIVGTEPSQGAALAMAVLESLASRGARGFVTTHYERLKTLAYEDPRFANASVGLDAETMTPSYALSIGEPGSSSPFEIAARLGMSATILGRAREIAGGHTGLSEALERLEATRAEAEFQSREAERAKASLDAERIRLEIQRENLERRAKAEVAALFAEARRQVREATRILAEQVSEVQRDKDPASLASKRRRVIEAAATIADAGAEFARTTATTDNTTVKPSKRDKDKAHDGGPLAAPPVPGDRVWVHSLDAAGDVVEIRGKSVVVAVGAFRTTVKAAALGRLAGVAPASPRPAGTAKKKQPAAKAILAKGVALRLDPDDPAVPPPRNDANSVDVRGCRRDEIADLVEPLLDRAWREQREAIWVIHGHGSGALRDEVRTLVRRSHFVTAWRPGRRHEGGDGVTIAWLARDA